MHWIVCAQFDFNCLIYVYLCMYHDIHTIYMGLLASQIFGDLLQSATCSIWIPQFSLLYVNKTNLCNTKVMHI